MHLPLFNGSWTQLWQDSSGKVYLDDIIVFSRTFDEHINDLREVLNRLRNANLKLKTSKCHFFQKELKYLGNIVSSQGIAPDRTEIEAIVQMKPPTKN
jgi:hypothetical protein